MKALRVTLATVLVIGLMAAGLVFIYQDQDLDIGQVREGMEVGATIVAGETNPQEYIDAGIPCIETHFNTTEPANWRQLNERISSDLEKMQSVEPPYQLSSYHYSTIDLLRLLQKEGEGQPLDSRPDISKSTDDALERWQSSIPDVIDKRCS